MTLSLTNLNIKSVHGVENQILSNVNVAVDLARVLAVQNKIPNQKVCIYNNTMRSHVLIT